MAKLSGQRRRGGEGRSSSSREEENDGWRTVPYRGIIQEQFLHGIDRLLDPIPPQCLFLTIQCPKTQSTSCFESFTQSSLREG
mmetsp:Transcript_27725/g.44036  ORF Transcript_27725/g.44036 Transcript_27725/m.44036 type:complete len:83 (+) Transcript_27725:1259-1507(+)